MEKPQENSSESNFKLYKPGYHLARLVLGQTFEQNIQGTELILPEPGIFAMNHQKLVDSVFLSMAYTKATGLPLAMIAQSEYFDGLGIRGKDGKRRFGRSTQLIVNSVGAIPIDRDGGDISSLRKTMDAVAQSIENGVSVGVHPDATRAENGKVNRFHPLFTRLAMELGVPLYGVGGHYSETESRKSKHIDLTFTQPFTTDYYNSAHLKLLPKNKRIDHVNNELEKRVALAAHLEQSHDFAVIKRPTNESNTL